MQSIAEQCNAMECNVTQCHAKHNTNTHSYRRYEISQNILLAYATHITQNSTQTNTTITVTKLPKRCYCTRQHKICNTTYSYHTTNTLMKCPKNITLLHNKKATRYTQNKTTPCMDNAKHYVFPSPCGGKRNTLMFSLSPVLQNTD